jgi:hypothetical protein
MIAGLLTANAVGAQEQFASPFDDHFRLTAGLLSASSETEMRLDADDGTPGTLVDAESDLGLRDQSEQADVEAELRIRERHRVRFSYFRLDRSATQTIDRQILFGDEVFDAGDLVESRLDWREFSVTYGYTFLRKARVEIYGSFGLHLVETSAQGEVAAEDIREEEAEAVPLPAFGLGTLVRFSDRFHLEARVDYLTANIDEFDGTVLDARAALLYRFNRNLAVGAAYMLMEREGNSEEVGDSGHFSLRNSGPELLLRVAF